MVDMVHTMLTFLQQLDMLHWVLLPYMTIQVHFMGVSIFHGEVHEQLNERTMFYTVFFIDKCNSVGTGGESSQRIGKKIFVGRLPQEATAEDLRRYFSRFGRILDVYVPKVRQH